MGVVVAALGMIATVQGVAWIGRPPETRRFRLWGTVLAPVGLGMFTWGLFLLTPF